MISIYKSGAIVIKEDNGYQILIGLNQNMLFFPKGHVESDENPVSGARRECIEELQWMPNTCLGRILQYQYDYSDNPGHVILDWYLFYDAIQVNHISGEEFDKNSKGIWLPMKSIERYLESYSVPWQKEMDMKIVKKLRDIL